MNTTYTSAGLSRLYHAIREQAEQEFLDAMRRECPDMTPEEEMHLLNYYRNLQSRAEAQICAEYDQSRGNEK